MLLVINSLDAKFPMGMIVMTPGVETQVSEKDLNVAFSRHAAGDWGDLDAEDRESNEEALREGYRLLSAYDSNGTKFWIITEADRSVTTALLPEEY